MKPGAISRRAVFGLSSRRILRTNHSSYFCTAKVQMRFRGISACTYIFIELVVVVGLAEPRSRARIVAIGRIPGTKAAVPPKFCRRCRPKPHCMQGESCERAANSFPSGAQDATRYSAGLDRRNRRWGHLSGQLCKGGRERNACG